MIIAGGGIFAWNYIKEAVESPLVESPGEPPPLDPVEVEGFFSYSVGGGMDTYSDGDLYGHKLEIDYNKDYTLYERIYYGEPGDSTISENKIGQGALDTEDFESLNEVIEESDFFVISQSLPDVSPLEVGFREPAKTVEITMWPTTDEDPHTVRAYMGVDRKHYPENFLSIKREVREILQELREFHYNAASQ